MSRERESKDAPLVLEVRAYSPPKRIFTVVLQIVAGLNVLYLGLALAEDILFGTEGAPPLVVALGLGLFSCLPLALFFLLRWLSRGELELGPSTLVLTLRRKRFEIPVASIKALHPHVLPLPEPGVALEMSSGRRFSPRLHLADPSVLISQLGFAEDAGGHASVAYAHAKDILARRRLRYWLLKFGLFPLALAMLLFRLHQVIVYGGGFGQYHLFGLMPYLKSFGIVWGSTLLGFVVHAAALRVVAEALALAATSLLAGRAMGIRRVAEILCQVGYFGVVPGYVTIRLLL